MDKLPPAEGDRDQISVFTNLLLVEGKEQLLAVTNLVMMSVINLS